MADSQNENTHKLFVSSSLPGGSGVRAFRHLPPRSPAEGGRKGAGDILHHTVHRHLQEGRPEVGSRLKFKFKNVYFEYFFIWQDGVFRRSAAGGQYKRLIGNLLKRKNLNIIIPTSVCAFRAARSLCHCSSDSIGLIVCCPRPLFPLPTAKFNYPLRAIPSTFGGRVNLRQS